MKPEDIKFIELEDNSEDGLNLFMYNHDCVTCYLVYLRQKYSYENEWSYSTELLIPRDFTYEWDSDWWEGQDFVEYLAIACVD